ncbi:TPA: WcbI family polysaccharide biosynthesis putative acetyltransferase [Vibrio parahaemolyticus]
MNDKEINETRDVAKIIMKQNKKLAFELFSLCLKHRPHGPYLKSQFFELKKKLKIKTFVVLGNCQSQPISELIDFKDPSFHILSSLKVHEMRNMKTMPSELYYADYIITQNLGDSFGVLETNNIKNTFSDKVVVIPGCFFKGNHQDWSYFNHIGPNKNNINRVQSPIGDYHNQTVYDSFAEGLDVEATLQRLTSVKYNKEKYGHLAKESISELKLREKLTDIDISDFIWSCFKSGKNVFHSFNHPKKVVLNELVNRVLTKLQLDHNKQPSPGECLDWTILSGNILAGNRTSIITKGAVYSEEQFVKDSFEIYRKLQSQAL